MFDRKADPKDELIAILRQDKERLELRVGELTKQLIAIVDARAHGRLYREPLATPDKPAEPWIDPQRLAYKPALSFADVAIEAQRREELS